MWSGFLESIRMSWTAVRRSPGYMLLYIIVGVMAVFYQGLCMLIIPFLYAIQKLMDIQLSLCVSLLQSMFLSLYGSEMHLQLFRDNMEGSSVRVGVTRCTCPAESLPSLLSSAADAKVREIASLSVKCVV